MVTSGEIVRSLGLLFYVCSSRPIAPTGIPLQPNTRPFSLFFADFRDSQAISRPNEYYPFRPYWSFLSEPSGLLRLYSMAFVLFEYYFEIAVRSGGPDPGPGPDLEEVMQLTGSDIETLLVRSANLTDMEDQVEANLHLRTEESVQK